MLFLWLLACQPADRAEAPGAPARGESPELQSARAAPAAAPWSGPWTVTLHAERPDDPAVVAWAAALGQAPRPWARGPLAPARGEVAVVWVDGATPGEGVAQALKGARPPGEVVVVAGPGRERWSAATLAEVAWAGAAIVDPLASAALWGDPADDPPATLGAVAARVLAEQYALAYTPPAAPQPPGLDEWLRPVTEDDLRSPDPVTRTAGALYRPPALAAAADALAADPEVAVRLAVATTTADPAVRARLAEDRDPLVRARAVDGLTDLAALLPRLDDPSSVVRVVAAHAVAHHPDPAAATALERLAGSTDAYVRWKAARGLATRGDVQRLVGLLRDPDIDVRREAAHALERRADRLTIPALVAASEDDNSFVRRQATAALAAMADDPAARAALEARTRDPAGLVRMVADQALGRRVTPWSPEPPPRDDAEAAARVASADPTTRKDVCRFLFRRTDAAALGWLDTLRADADSEVRKSAVEALGWGGAARDRLLAALADPDLDTLVTALQALRRSGDAPAEPLRPLLLHPDAEVRLRAAEAGAAAFAEADRARLAADPDERVRAAVVGLPGAPLAADEPSVLVRAAAAAREVPDAGADRLVAARVPLAPLHLVGFADGVLAREDELVHLRFSWNDERDRPAAYRALRPPVVRPYGHPDRG